MKSQITFEMLTTEQLKGLLEVREGKNLEYELWQELHVMGLVTFNMIGGAPLEDVLTDRALEILGVLAHG